MNPTADIAITVQILDDDFGTGALAIGASNVETVDISQPGLGAEKFRIDTTPQVAILTFPDRQVVPLLQTSTDVRLVTVTTGDDGGGGGDTRATSERFLELRVINPDGTEGPGYRLPARVLNNLPALFRNLPDNHYKIYLVQSETNARRLVIEVFVRNGKLIDPGDDSEGARDRPPTEESTTLPADDQPAAAPVGEIAPPVETPVEPEPQASLQGTMRPRSSSAIYHSATLAGVAIALSGAGKSRSISWKRPSPRPSPTNGNGFARLEPAAPRSPGNRQDRPIPARVNADSPAEGPRPPGNPANVAVRLAGVITIKAYAHRLGRPLAGRNPCHSERSEEFSAAINLLDPSLRSG